MFCPRNSLSLTVTIRGPELQLCSNRMHFEANSANAFAPHVSPQWKNRHRAPECRFANLCGRSGTEKPRLGEILPPPKPEHNVLRNVGQRQKIRTASFAISRKRLAALPWGLRLAIRRRRRGLHQRKNELDSRLRW